MEYVLKWSLDGHRGPINSIAFMEDGSHIATGGDDGHVIVWFLDDGSIRKRLKPKQGPVISLKWLRDDHPNVYYLLSAGANGTVVIWRFNIGSVLFEWVHMETVFDSPIESAELDHTHRCLALTTQGRIALYQITKENENKVGLHLIQAHPPFQHPRLPVLPISAHFFNQGHCVLFAFLDSREIIAWNIAPWKQIFHHKLKTCMGSTAYHEKSRLLLVWNLVDGADIYSLTGQPTYSLHHFDLEGNLAITGTDNGQVLVWDVNSGRLTQVLHHGKELHAVQVVSYHSSQFNKNLIASGSSNTTSEQQLLRVWSTELITRSDDSVRSTDDLHVVTRDSFPAWGRRCLQDIFFATILSIFILVGIHWFSITPTLDRII